MSNRFWKSLVSFGPTMACLIGLPPVQASYTGGPERLVIGPGRGRLGCTSLDAEAYRSVLSNHRHPPAPTRLC